MTSNLDFVSQGAYHSLVLQPNSLAEAWSAVPLISVHLPFLQFVPSVFGNVNFVFQRSIWAVTAAVVVLLLTFLHLALHATLANNFFSYLVQSILQFWNNSVLERVHYKWRDVSMLSLSLPDMTNNATFYTQTVTKPLGFFSLGVTQRKTTGVWVTVLFFVLLCSNSFGLVPLCTLVTGQAGTTLGLSILLLILITLAGMQRLKMRFVKLFLPSGPSWPMAPLFILLESISYSFR